MIGNHAVSVIAEAYRKGFRGFDAERAYAAEFCNAPLDPSEERHRDSLLAGGGNFRALFDAHLKRLSEMCIYDPDGWCRDRGFERR